MALGVTGIGPNPSYPGQYSEAFIPDQLIAGNLKLVTDTVLIGGATVLPRGSVLGAIGTGAVTSSAGKTPGTGTITVAAVPTAGDTLTIAGTPITFVAANPTGNQVQIGGPGPGGIPPATPTIAGTVSALLNFLVGSTDANLIKSTYSANGAVITASAVQSGTGGNALTLATSNGTAFTLSGATFAGGTANTGAETIGSISAGPRTRPGNYTVTLISATQAVVEDPFGVQLGTATVGTPFVDPQINFTITTGSGIAAGDAFTLSAANGSGAYVLATAGAADGSGSPVAILADRADPTGGPVMAPVYLTGEFNINAMTFGNGLSVAAAKAALRPFNIHLKTAVTANDPA